MGSERLRWVREAWRRIQEEGHAAGMETLFEHCHPDCRFAMAASSGRVFQGVAEIRAFFREQRDAGADVSVSPYSFVEKGDRVEVLGSVRLIRPDGGGMAVSQGRWTYTFRDDLIVEATYSPSAAAAA